MKNISNFLTEAKHNEWEIPSSNGAGDFQYKKDADFLWIQDDSKMYGFLTIHDIEEMGKDFEDEEWTENVLNLKPGEICDADGGINLYIRLK